LCCEEEAGLVGELGHQIRVVGVREIIAAVTVRKVLLKEGEELGGEEGEGKLTDKLTD
jgi:hypothetical protein